MDNGQWRIENGVFQMFVFLKISRFATYDGAGRDFSLRSK